MMDRICVPAHGERPQSDAAARISAPAKSLNFKATSEGDGGGRRPWTQSQTNRLKELGCEPGNGLGSGLDGSLGGSLGGGAMLLRRRKASRSKIG